MSEEKELVEAKSLGSLLGMEFDSAGKLSKADDLGGTRLFTKLNRKQRRARGVYSHKFQKILKRV